MRVPTACLTSTLAIATALLMPGQAARAQSFQGDPSVVAGSAGVSTGPGTTTVTVGTPQAVINWKANGSVSNGVQVFQDSGTALFQNGRGVGDFFVLNRILPSGDAKVSLNGIINSRVDGVRGGTVFFYSPNGLIIGSDARIDVGRLGLTTSDPWDGQSSSWFDTAANRVTFRQALAGSSVQVNAGAQITATGGGNYVAMVAPVIDYAGSTRVDGAAALVAAEAATITFNPNGLFDIQVTVGSGGAGRKLTSSGSIIGEDKGSSPDNRRIYMVAVPKNDAITMAVTGGTLGFDVAGAAQVVGNAVVLSAGHNITAGQIDERPAKVAEATASMSVTPARVTSALYARASDSISLGNRTVTVGGNIVGLDATYDSSVDLAAVNAIEVFARNGGKTQINRPLTASTSRRGSGESEDVTAGSISLLAEDGGELDVESRVSLYADGTGGDSFTPGMNAGDGTGGTVLLQTSNGGQIGIDEDLFISASGRGGDLRELGGTAGAGTGGTVRIDNIGTGGSIAMDDPATIIAQGIGGGPWDCSNCGGNGGRGQGGTVLLSGGTGAGNSSVFKQLNIDVDGRGGVGVTGASGAGTGGTVELLAKAGASLEIRAADIAAQGYGGPVYDAGVAGALGTGGTVSVRADNGSVITGALDIRALGFGSFAAFGLDSGAGQGGSATFEALDGGSVRHATLYVDVTGSGGGNDGGGNGGDGTGGKINVSASGGGSSFVVAGNAALIADGRSGPSGGECIGCSGDGGVGRGGTINVGKDAGGSGNAIEFGGRLYLSASGYGGLGSSGAGGNAIGGDISLLAQAGTPLFIGGDLDIEAYGSAGPNDSGGIGGDGEGGTVLVASYDRPVEGYGLSIGGKLSVDVGGYGGASFDRTSAGGSAGDGLGGSGIVSADGGSILVAEDLTIAAIGRGGEAVGGTGGSGFGKEARIEALGGGAIRVAGDSTADASGSGGEGRTGGVGRGGGSENGEESGDGANLVADGGTISIGGTASALTDGRGGDGAELGGGAGGDGVGGWSTILAANDASGPSSLSAATTIASANGTGGSGGSGGLGQDGGAGGRGTGGRVNVLASAGNGRLTLGSTTLTANGTGGAGGAGGDGDAGLAIASGDGGAGGFGDAGTTTFGADSGSDEDGGQTDGRAIFGAVLASSNGTGGAGGDAGSGFGSANGGAGGGAERGSTVLLARGAEVQLTGPVTMEANATGAAGGAGSGPLGRAGAGGDATLVAPGGVDIVVTDRASFGTRGLLTGGTITATSIATANGGATINAGGSGLLVRNADLDVGSLTINVSAASEADAAVPSYISVTNGEALVDSFSFSTSGSMSLFVDAGLLDVGSLKLSAADFVPDAAEPPSSPGLIRAQTADITTANNFTIAANMVVASPFTLIVPGSITIGDLTGGSTLSLTAQGGFIQLGDIAAAGDPSAEGDDIDISAAADVRLADVAADRVGIEAGGVAQFNGAVTVGDILVTSNDIAIGPSGSMTASGLLNLRSTNGAGMLIGDGLSGTGYGLSNGEFGKLTGGSIYLGSIGGEAQPGMLIGDLDVGGSQIGDGGTLAFYTGVEGRAGTIRVNGNVAASGFNLDQTIAFSTGRFELNAATGSVGIADSSGNVSGYLELLADQVWVADEEILGKLAADPFYAGREDDLNQAAAVQRPEGVLRAFDITVFEANQILVQNAGTLDVPAGILAADGDIIGQAPSAATVSALAEGQIELIINGQIATEGGTITGPAVWEAVTSDPDFTPTLFTANSSINGCLLTAATCGQPDPGPEPTVDPPRPDLTFDTEPPLSDQLFTGDEACDSARPQSLVNDCALRSDQLIEEPVAGSGNAALIEGGGKQ